MRARRAAEETERKERQRDKDDLIKRNAETQDLVNSRKQQGKKQYYHYLVFPFKTITFTASFFLYRFLTFMVSLLNNLDSLPLSYCSGVLSFFFHSSCSSTYLAMTYHLISYYLILLHLHLCFFYTVHSITLISRGEDEEVSRC